MNKTIIETEECKDIENICEIYKTMTYDGNKPKEGFEKARCMLFAQKYYYEEVKRQSSRE